MAETTIYKPHSGFQSLFTRSNVDVCFGGGILGGGKTAGAVLATAEPSLDSNWRGLFLRNNLDDVKAAGGLIDTFREFYGDYIQVRSADMPRVMFPQGSYVDVTHAADQSIAALQRRFKGRQYDLIYFDELSNFSWDAFKTILSRNRGKSKYAGKCLATTNPERECWVRDFIDWYIDPEGYIMEERNGIVRYFYMLGPDVKSVIWGDSKEEVYRVCKADIDKKLDKVWGFMQGRDKWPSMIKSFTYYLGRLSENKEMLEANPDYVGSIALSGGAEADKLLMGNWNVSSRDEEGTLVTFDEANSVFTNDPQRNNDRWVTADLADTGTNNFLQLAWDGLDIIDIDIMTESTPKENADHIKMFAAKNNVADSHILYDAVRAGIYVNDYIPAAVPFEGYRSPFGIDALQYMKLKDYCYGKFIWLVKNGYISCVENVARKTFEHKKLKDRITIQEEFIREIRVVRFVDAQNGKKRLLTKKELNKQLGSGQSLDLLDCCAMRMYPLLKIANGYELESSRYENEMYEDEQRSGQRVNIYEDANFGISYGF